MSKLRAGDQMPERITIGTAGWSIPRALAAHFGGDGSHLQRYARVLRGAEINSSFHRPHKPAVYAKWAAATPRGFHFAVKLPRTITHDHKLRRARQRLAQFLEEPRTYRSRYDAAFLARIADALRGIPSAVPAWCIFDNTASGAALENARELQTLMAGHPRRSPISEY